MANTHPSTTFFFFFQLRKWRSREQNQKVAQTRHGLRISSTFCFKISDHNRYILLKLKLDIILQTVKILSMKVCFV